MKYLGMTIHSLGIVLAGIWLCGAAIKTIWPDINNYGQNNLNINIIEND